MRSMLGGWDVGIRVVAVDIPQPMDNDVDDVGFAGRRDEVCVDAVIVETVEHPGIDPGGIVLVSQIVHCLQ